jgi:hypothetical protein
MIDSTVRLPNGHEVTVSFPEGTSDKEIKDWVLNEYVLNRDPGSIFGRSIAQGIDDLQQKWGSSLEGLGNVIDAESLSRVGGEIVANNQNEIEARRYREQQYTTESEGFQKGIDYVAGLVGQSAPQMATTMAGALAGAKIGAVGGPLAWATVPAGAFMGGFLVNMPFFYGDNRERQKEAIERGYRTEMDEGAAALTAIPQSSLDSILGAIGAKFIATPLMKIQGGILTKAIKGSATGSIIETPTELGQQVLNRYQSGLPIYDDEAIREYVDAAIGGAVLGGLFGGAGGAYSGIRGGGEVDQAPTGQEEQAPRDEMRIKQPSFAEPVADEALRYRVTYTDEFTGEEAQLELEASNPEDAINKVATGLGLEASGMQVETIFPFAEPEVAPTEPEVAPTEPEVAAVEPEVIPTEPGVALAEPEVMPTEPMVTPAEPTVTQAEPEVTPRINEPSGFKFSKDEGKPDPKYSGGETVNYANDFSRAVRISPNSKIFKKVRERLKKDYELTDSELDALRKKANDRLLQQKRSGKPLSLDMTKDLPSRAPIAPEVAVEPEVIPTEPKVAPPAQDLDVEAIREQESIVSDADARIMELESEVDIEKSNIKEARAENKKKIAEVRKSNLSKEEKQEMVEDLKAELQDTIDDINGNIGIYKEEISAFKSDKRKAAKKLSKLTTPAEPTIAPEEEAELQAELQQEFLSGDQDVTAGAAETDGEPKKTTRGYDLLDSPFIEGYSGDGPSDTSIPDYDSFHYVVSEDQRQKLNAAIKSGAIDNLADQVAEEAAEMVKDPEIAAGIGWYGRMRTRLKQIFGQDVGIFTQLLGTTSAQTPVETNFRFSVDLYNRFKAGEFDAKIKEYLRLYGMMKSGKLGDLLLKDKVKNSMGVVYTPEMIKKSSGSALLSSAAEHYNLVPRQPSGKKYGTNSYPALKALAQVWFDERLGKNKMTPKTPQFTMNLNGESLEATIDVWAARLLRRVIYKGQEESRIFPSEETAVSNPDFALGQLVFRRAAQRMNMNPDDLQALVWFGEKQIWDENGWTGAVGALKSSFDEPADVFYPVDGSTRSEADAKLILDFLAKERLVKRDIAFPDTISKTTQANNRRDYDQLLRTSVIIDYLKSRGSGAVYESRSVESDRKRQITRSINRLSSYTGKVSYKKGTGEEPTRSLKVVRKGPVLGNKGFVKFAKANKDGHKFGSSVDVFEESNYEAHDLIITSSESGQGVTLAISPDGELSSVTRSPGATQEDVNAAFDMAISTGKVKFLNGFETILPDKYASYGFTPVARLKFDPTQQPPGWSYETYKEFNDGKPDVIFMRFDGTVGSEYNPEGFPEVQSYEAGIEAALTSEPTTEDVTAPTAEGETIGRRFPSIKAMEDFVNNAFLGMAKMLGIDIVPNYTVGGGGAQYNATRGVIEYNPRMLLNERSKNEIRAIFREEIIHAAMHNVLMKRNPNKSRNAAWLDFMGDLGRSLTQAEKDAISGVYLNMDSDVAVGSEYSRAVIQQALYGEITESYASKAFNKLLNVIKSVQSYMARVFGGDVDIDPEVAQVIRDSAELVMALDPSARLTNQKVVQKATDIANMAEGNQELTSDVVANAGKPPSKKAGIGFFKKYLFTPSVIMDNIHPELSRLFHKFFNGIDMETLAYMKRMAPFIKKFNAIENEKDKRRLKQLIYYSPDIDPRAEDVQPRIQERTALLRKYGMLQDYEIQVRSVLNAIRQRAIQQGMDVAFLNDFFPRLVLDLDSIREYYGETIVKDFSSYIERINEVRRKELDPKKRKPPIQRGSIEEAIEFEKYIRSGEYTKSGAKPRNTKARTIEFIDDEILDSYADPGEAVEHYIHSMILSTRTMQLLGRRYEVEGENILFEKSGELGALIQRLVMNNEIDEETAFRTIPQFARMILNPVMKENAFLSNLRSFGYLTLLVEPTSTLSNLFDLPFVMYQKGFLPTLSAMLGKKAIRLEDIGIDPQQISLEFKSEKKLLAEAVRIGLKSTGFTRLDQLLKETNLNANYNYYRKLSSGYLRDRSSTASRKLKVELDFLLGEDADAAIAAFAKGDRNNALVREVVLRKILETQPLNRMEIPLGQSENANKRMLYSMKSFQVKQLNFVVSRMLSKIFSTETSKAEKAAGLKDLSKLMFFMLLVGMPVDALKDLLAGRIGYLSDYLFNGIFRLAGVSRYTAYTVKKEGLGEAAISYFTPVGMQQIADIAMELQRVASGQKAITDSKLVTLAPFSDVINRLFGFTKEREMKEYRQRIKKGESPILVPPGSLR